MEFSNEFYVWLKNHDDLCKEAFHLHADSIIAYFVTGKSYILDIIYWQMGSEDIDDIVEYVFDERLKNLYGLFCSIELVNEKFRNTFNELHQEKLSHKHI